MRDMAETRRPRKLYVSRSALRPQGMVLGSRFEQQLEHAGFTIFLILGMALLTAVDHYRKAEIVVFPEGSACHGTELLGAGMMGRTFLLPRRGGQRKQRSSETSSLPARGNLHCSPGCTESWHGRRVRDAPHPSPLGAPLGWNLAASSRDVPSVRTGRIRTRCRRWTTPPPPRLTWKLVHRYLEAFWCSLDELHADALIHAFARHVAAGPVPIF